MSLAIPPDCLRPASTETIAQHLDGGLTVNVFGDEGQGLHQLVEDLKNCCPETAKFVRVSMRACAGSYDGFLEAVCTSLGIPDRAGLDFRSLLNRYLDAGSHQVWLCLEYFDRLSDEKVDNKSVDTKGYDIDFLNYLNSLHNSDKVSLLLTSKLAILGQELYIGGKRVRGSRLDISKHIPLEDLTFSEIEAQLRRFMKESPEVAAFFKEKPAFYTPLVYEISNHAAPFLFLEFMAKKVPLVPTTMAEFQKLLAFWKADFGRKFSHTRDIRISNLERWVGKLLDRTTRLFGISNLLQKTKKQVLLILGSTSAMILALMKYGAEAWSWISALFSK